jgi:hypothetical protein
MAGNTGAGSNDPPYRSPFAVPASKFGAAFEQYGQTDKLQELESIEWRVSTEWGRFFSEIARLIATIGAAVTTDYGVTLTSAASVTPTLENAAENGTFAVLLDRATTNIEPATLDGAYPPDWYRFSILAINDATDGRLLTWDALYLGVPEGSGTPGALNFYNFTTLPSGAGFAISTPISTVEP